VLYLIARNAAHQAAVTRKPVNRTAVRQAEDKLGMFRDGLEVIDMTRAAVMTDDLMQTSPYVAKTSRLN
jgi:hypothetical protein